MGCDNSAKDKKLITDSNKWKNMDGVLVEIYKSRILSHSSMIMNFNSIIENIVYHKNEITTLSSDLIFNNTNSERKIVINFT